MKNLLPNPKCNLDPKGQRVAPPPWLIEGGFLKGPELIPGWYFWPHWDAKPEKRYADVKYGFDDSFSLVGKDLKAGAFVADLSVKEGNFYAVEAYMQGSGSAFIKVKFSDAKRNWLFPHAGLRDVCIYPEMDEKNGWKKAFGVVCAPAGATYMTILLYMKQRKGEYNRFDNAAVYEIQPLTGEK
ncbi:MAG: hypothetical protein EOM73_15590 [Bacteroidia bacterium]|nr:hypothetical protein [Bacteroidia bacterium]